MLSAYLSRNSTLKNNFKKDTHRVFREKLIIFINEKYQFYRVKPKEDTFLEKYFKLLNGKVYKTSQVRGEFLLALEKTDDIKTLVGKMENDIEVFENFCLE